MPTNANIPPPRDEVIAEIASVLAQGCLRLRKSRRISPEIGNEAGKDKHSQVFTENRLDRSGHRSVHE